jgi:hypothetical protein
MMTDPETQMSKKSFLIKLPVPEGSGSNVPNFAYLSINPANEEFLVKTKNLLEESGCEEIKRLNYRLPDFVCDMQGGGIDDVNICHMHSCNLIITKQDFLFEVRVDEFYPDVRVARITFEELRTRPSDSAVEKVPLTLVAEWDSGEPTKIECLMNPYNGGLNLSVADVSQDESPERTFVVSESGDKYRVHYDPSIDQYWVSPFDLESLLENTHAESPNPR